jgi:hypothetical protein
MSSEQEHNEAAAPVAAPEDAAASSSAAAAAAPAAAAAQPAAAAEPSAAGTASSSDDDVLELDTSVAKHVPHAPSSGADLSVTEDDETTDDAYPSSSDVDAVDGDSPEAAEAAARLQAFMSQLQGDPVLKAATNAALHNMTSSAASDSAAPASSSSSSAAADADASTTVTRTPSEIAAEQEAADLRAAIAPAVQEVQDFVNRQLKGAAGAGAAAAAAAAAANPEAAEARRAAIRARKAEMRAQVNAKVEQNAAARARFGAAGAAGAEDEEEDDSEELDTSAWSAAARRSAAVNAAAAASLYDDEEEEDDEAAEQADLAARLAYASAQEHQRQRMLAAQRAMAAAAAGQARDEEEEEEDEEDDETSGGEAAPVTQSLLPWLGKKIRAQWKSKSVSRARAGAKWVASSLFSAGKFLAWNALVGAVVAVPPLAVCAIVEGNNLQLQARLHYALSDSDPRKAYITTGIPPQSNEQLDIGAIQMQQ